MKRIIGAIYGYRLCIFFIFAATVAAHFYLEFLIAHFVLLGGCSSLRWFCIKMIKLVLERGGLKCIDDNLIDIYT